MPHALLRRSLLTAGFAATIPAIGHAQPAIPDRGVRLMVGFGSGGGIDQIARQIAPPLERRVGRHIAVENRPGGTGAAAGEALKTGPNDGSFLALIPSVTIAARVASKAYSFDPLVDIAPISLVCTFPFAFAVSPRIGVSTMEEYLAWLKEDEGRARIGTSALSEAFDELYAKMISRELGAKMDFTGYRNASGMMADLADGRIPAAVGAMPTLLQHHRGGRAKILFVMGDKRVSVAPRIPTSVEVGLTAIETPQWFILCTGGKAPRAAINAWNTHIRGALEDKALATGLTQYGVEVETSTPAEARDRIAQHLEVCRSRLESFGVASR
jgi:tripartite-type tricarboxylate transporter receptor subunit TctC